SVGRRALAGHAPLPCQQVTLPNGLRPGAILLPKKCPVSFGRATTGMIQNKKFAKDLIVLQLTLRL
ncbi:MAG: hypothetical protein WBO48_22545, partial [Candidatus Promineifilaceae bacterium]